jgi:light-regulated signal transduction histidine kinase (bacteriophytochrome)
MAEKATELTNADDALNAALANLTGAIAETGAAIERSSLPAVRIHPLQLAQIFQNLISNALKYHRPGVAPVVSVYAGHENGNWVISVADNGIGIEPEYKENIFGLFKRLHTGDEYSGTGIGLALCQRIVDRHHGRIWVESEPGKGSIFRFTVPQ